MSLSTNGGRKTAKREKKAGPINDSAGLDISPDDVNAITKVADWFENNLHLQPPKMPFYGLQAPASNTKSNDEAVELAESSPTRRFHHRSPSLPSETDLEMMWKTGQSNTLSPPVKQRKKHGLSQDSHRRRTYHTPPSKLLIRMKYQPQHRSPQVNQAVSSIMKPPKYSPRVSLNLDAEIDEDPTRRSKAVRNRAQSMPPPGPLPDLFGKRHSITTASCPSSDSNCDSDVWIPKGVEFQRNAEVYIFNK